MLALMIVERENNYVSSPSLPCYYWVALLFLYISDCDKFSPLLEKLTAPHAADNKDFKNDASESDSEYFEEDEDKQPTVVGGASNVLFRG
jgi:hypothetical protein